MMKHWDIQKLNGKWEISAKLGKAGESGRAEATKEKHSRTNSGQWQQSTKQYWVNRRNEEYVSEHRLPRAHVSTANRNKKS